jgi:hypothetical protein
MQLICWGIQLHQLGVLSLVNQVFLLHVLLFPVEEMPIREANEEVLL